MKLGSPSEAPKRPKTPMPRESREAKRMEHMSDRKQTVAAIHLPTVPRHAKLILLSFALKMPRVVRSARTWRCRQSRTAAAVGARRIDEAMFAVSRAAASLGDRVP